MRGARSARGWAWAVVPAFVLVIVIFVPSLIRSSGVDLDEHVEPGTIWYMLVHDSRWMVGAMVGFMVAVLRESARGLLRNGVQEWREWRRRSHR